MKVNEIITQKILEALALGTVPWQMTWAVDGLRNVVSRKLYRGINIFVLAFLGRGENYFLTYNQAKSLGGNVKKGAKGIPVCFFTRIESKTQMDANGKAKMIPLLRYYTVFRVTDCEGLKWERPTSTGCEFEPIACAEALAAMFTACTVLTEGQQPAYYPAENVIRMPAASTFKSPAAYYATLFHEMGHALYKVTDAKLEGQGESYSKEELTAEVFASFCLNHCGLLSDDLFTNSVSYIDGWRRKLSTDASLVISASSKAQRRFDNLLGTKPEEEKAEA